MKVAVFLDDYAPSEGGGYTFQSEVFHSLLELAPESQHDFVFVASQPEQVAADLAGKPYQLLPYRPPNLTGLIQDRLGREFPGLRRARRWRSRLERDLADAGVEFVWFLGPRVKPVDLPYLTIVYDLQHRLQPWFPEVSAYGEWTSRERPYARNLRRAAYVIAGTQAGQAEIERFYQLPAERIRILPHPTPGFALAPPAEEINLKARFGLEDGFLFYPAQFWPHKNHANLLYALQLLRDEHDIRLPLALVGADHGNLAYIKGLTAELGLRQQLHFLGFVSQAEMLALYRGALALTYMTFFGPENLPPLEAFALGCPVVASRVSGAQEQLGEAALLVDPKQPAEIAAAIRRLYEDAALRQELIAKGRARAQQWTVPDFVRGVFAILDEFALIRRSWGASG